MWNENDFFQDLKYCCITVIQPYYRNILKHNDERTHFFRKICLSHFILERVCERVDVGYVWEVSWRWRDCHILTPSSSDHSSTSSFCWAAQPGSLRAQALCLELVLTRRASYLQLELRLEFTAPNWLWHLVIKLFDAPLLPVGVHICTEFNHVHRSRWYSDILNRMHLLPVTQVHLLIDSSVEGQYVTVGLCPFPTMLTITP